MKYSANYLKTLVLIGAIIFASAAFVSAGSTGLGIMPTKASHTMNPGESVSGIISLKNASDGAIKVEAEIQDFIPTAGTGMFQFVKRAEGVTTVRDWVTLDIPEEFIFKKGDAKEIKYTIKAPPDAEPGSHFGIAFFTAKEKDESGMLKIGTRLGMMIYVTVPGNFLQKGKILKFEGPVFVQGGPVNFKIKFENTGTVHFEPKGGIKITNIFGKEVGNVPIEGQTVLPTGIRDLAAQWNVSSFLLGRYRAEISIKDGEGNILTSDSVAFYAFPLWYLLIFIIAVVALFFGLKFLKKKIKISIR